MKHTHVRLLKMMQCRSGSRVSPAQLVDVGSEGRMYGHQKSALVSRECLAVRLDSVSHSEVWGVEGEMVI